MLRSSAVCRSFCRIITLFVLYVSSYCFHPLVSCFLTPFLRDTSLCLLPETNRAYQLCKSCSQRPFLFLPLLFSQTLYFFVYRDVSSVSGFDFSLFSFSLSSDNTWQRISSSFLKIMLVSKAINGTDIGITYNLFFTERSEPKTPLNAKHVQASNIQSFPCTVS